MTARLRGAAELAVLALLAGCAASSHVTPSDGAARYLAIATPANRVLDASFDALEEHDDDPAAAGALLRTIATTERGFDHALQALSLPGPQRAIAARLVRVNEARAGLTSSAAGARDAADLSRDLVDLDALNVRVEAEVRALRSALGLPPPETS